MVDEVSQVVERSVDTELLDSSLARPLLWQGVTHGEVLEAEISHVDEVLVLRIEVVAAIVQDRRTGITLTGVATEQTRIYSVLVDIVVG